MIGLLVVVGAIAIVSASGLMIKRWLARRKQK